jgi:hypothetical protein
MEYLGINKKMGYQEWKRECPRVAAKGLSASAVGMPL